jgi:hypothetical protein
MDDEKIILSNREELAGWDFHVECRSTVTAR